MSGDAIPPGGEGTIQVTVQVVSRRQRIREVVRVQTNDPASPTTQIFVTANVLVDVEVIPALLRFVDEQSVTQVALKSYIDTPIELQEIRADRHLKVSVSALTIPAHGEVVVSAELIEDEIPKVLRGNVGGLVEIATDLTSLPVIRIPVWAIRKAD